MNFRNTNCVCYCFDFAYFVLDRIDICNSGENYTMCPLCTYCETWYLNKTCLMAKLAYLFDNGGTVFYATLMSFWGK